MSNYIYGFFRPADKSPMSDSTNITDDVRRQSSLGFQIVALESIPDVSGFPRSADLVYFNLSDHNETLGSEHLIFEDDWAEGYSGRLPYRLTDRIALIVDAVEKIAELSHSAEIGLWLSQVDQLEGVVEVPMSSLFDTIVSDFEVRGVPCLLYEVVP